MRGEVDVDKIVSILLGGPPKKLAAAHTDGEEPIPDIDDILEVMERCNKTYEALANESDIKFPDDSSWTDMANLADKLTAFVTYYFHFTEKREKFLITLNSIHKNFVTFTEAMDKHFDVLTYEIGRLDLQQLVQDTADKLVRRYDVLMSEPLSQRNKDEFVKICAMDLPQQAMLNLYNIVMHDPVESGFIWQALIASNGNEKLLQYWKIIVTSTCHKLVNVHSQYRSMDKVPKKLLDEEINDMKKWQQEMEERFVEINEKRKNYWKKVV